MATVLSRRRELLKNDLDKLAAGDALVSDAERRNLEEAAQQGTRQVAAAQSKELNRLAARAVGEGNQAALREAAVSAQDAAHAAALKANQQAAQQAAQAEAQRRDAVQREAESVTAANQQQTQNIMQGVDLGLDTVKTLAGLML